MIFKMQISDIKCCDPFVNGLLKLHDKHGEFVIRTWLASVIVKWDVYLNDIISFYFTYIRKTCDLVLFTEENETSSQNEIFENDPFVFGVSNFDLSISIYDGYAMLNFEY